MEINAKQDVSVHIDIEEQKRIAISLIYKIHNFGTFRNVHDCVVCEGNKIGYWQSCYHNDIEFNPICDATPEKLQALNIVADIINYKGK